MCCGEIAVPASQVDRTSATGANVKAHLYALGREVVPGFPQPRMRALEKLDDFLLDELPGIVAVQSGSSVGVPVISSEASLSPSELVAMTCTVYSGVVGQARDVVGVPLLGRSRLEVHLAD